jgi:enamine deaminase RidA (YjgF/YER057c/UK114 family)
VQTLGSVTQNGSLPANKLAGVGGCIRTLESQLAGVGSTLDDIVKFNFYLHDYDRAFVEAATTWMAEQYAGAYKPAVMFVTPPPMFDTAVDCVAICRKSVEPGKVLRVEGGAVLPPTNKLYISGYAGKGALDEATDGTLVSLQKTLEFCGLDWSHVVQLKSFLQPMSAHGDVRRRIKAFLGTHPTPVLSFVEWKSSETTPIEIELIAAVPPELGNKSADPVEYLTPPGDKASPVFSRVARVRSERTIYTSGLFAEKASDPAGQVREVLTRLKETVEPLGSDLRHLVKATYYVTDDVTSKSLGETRPEFYDPARPPAASKALVRSTCRPEKSISLDMIAVPKRAG